MGRGQDLLDAAREGQRHTVEKILAQISKRSGPFTSLRRVPDVNVQDDSGYTSLHHACLHGHKEIVRLLLSSDASPCIADKQGATPLHLAAFKGDSDIVAMLLVHDNPPVNIDHRTAKHETPLLIAAQFGFTDIVAKLMEKGADVTIRNISNESALDLAAQYGKLKTVQHLLYVHPHIVDQYKPPASRNRVFPLTPLNLASKNGHKDVVLTLLEEGVDPNVRTYDGTPLHEAARFDRASVVRILLEFGADLRIKDRRGNNVHDLLAESSEKATRRVRKVIREYENKIATTYDSDEDLPPFPVHDCSPTPAKAPETQKNTNNTDSLFSPSSSSLTKNHSQSFVKKLASKCLGLKAKFNSAPNISNNGGLEKEVDVKLKRSDNKSSTNTLLIGNSKFFKRLSKKEESGEIVCNDEFDTISLDRLGSLNRDSVVNRSNRSCPGFKTSLPNISENNELSDSNESVVITELDCDNSNEVKNDTIEAINYNANINIFEPRDRVSVISGESANLVNECYESFYFTKFDNDKSDKDNLFPRPAPRPNVSLSRLNSENTIYENVVIENKTIPTPTARTNVPQKLPLDVIESNILYENVSLIQEKKPEPPKRNVPPLQVYNVSNKDNNNSSNVSRSSTLSSDSMVDESNLEDIFLSQKSKSFRHGKVSSFCSTSSKSDIYRTPSNSSDDSDITEASAIENVDCSDDTDKKSIYLSNVGTLPNKKTDNSRKKKVLFRHKTFTNIEADRNSVKVKDLPQWNAEFLKETLANYHIRGTGHCVHKGPTIQEFISIFNRDTLNVSTISSNKNGKRDSFYETAICFCKPRPLKNYKSAENLVDISHQNIDSEVIIDINALKHQQELVLTSFRCFCDAELCNLHSKHRESPTDFIVKFSAIKKSISTPDITLENPPYSIVQKGNLPKNKSVPRNLQKPYADIDVNDIVARNKSKQECANTSSPNTLSQPSTLSSSSAGLYSIKDIAEIISLNSASTTNNSLSCASDIVHLPLRKSSSSEHSGHWSLQSCNSNVTIKSDMSFKSCIEESSDEDLDETLHSDVDSSDADTIKSDVSTSKRPWVHSDSFRFGSNAKPETIHVIREDNSFDDSKVDSKVESGISLEGSESSSSECDEDSGVPMVDANVSLGTASLERVSVVGGDCSGSGRRRWDETEGTSEGDALSVSSAASSCAPLHLAYHNDYNKVSPTPPKKPPRRNLSVSPTHANSPSSGYSYELRPHARSQDDLDDIQSAKQYLKLGRSVDHYVDGKLSYTEYEENHNNSPRIAPVPHPRPSLKQRSQPVAITAMYENVVIKEQNPRRKLRRNSFAPASDNIEIRMNDNRTRKYSNQERSSMESLLDDHSMNSPSNIERYCDVPKAAVPLSPTHYDQPPTPDHPPPSARQAERSIHEKIRPLSQLIMEVVEEIRIRKKSQGDIMNS